VHDQFPSSVDFSKFSTYELVHDLMGNHNLVEAGKQYDLSFTMVVVKWAFQMVTCLIALMLKTPTLELATLVSQGCLECLEHLFDKRTFLEQVSVGHIHDYQFQSNKPLYKVGMAC